MSVLLLGIIAGCTSGLAEPFDMSNLFYEYDTVSGSDGDYIVITKHLVSQSDVKIPDTIYDIPVREIADSTFAGDSKIQSVTFGKNMRRVGSNAFGSCPALTSVTFNVSMSDIGEYAFRDCVLLQSVPIPANLNSIGRGAFFGCVSLDELTIPETMAHIGGRAFYGTAWMKAQSETKYVIVGDGILIAYNGDKMELTIPKTVKQIAGAFAGNTAIESVKVGGGVTAIGDMSFMGCSSLKSVSIAFSVTEIGSNAFYGCLSLERIVLGDNIQSIGADALANCSAAIYVRQGSYAESYCKENGLDYFVMK